MTTSKGTNPCGNAHALSRMLGCLLGVFSSFGCGAEVEPGNDGSETHWLIACENDAECGQYSCVCGSCTMACDANRDCDESASAEAICVVPARLEDASRCEGDVPARICAERAEIEEGESSGENSEPEGVGPDTEPEATEPTEPEATTPTEPEPAAEPEATEPTEPDATSPTEPDPSGVICDGSDDVRLVVREDGPGRLPAEYNFAQVYGERYLAIDGHCNYWVNAGRALATGTIADESVLRAYESAVYGKLSDLTEYESPECSDPVTSKLWDPSGAAAAYFDCGSQDWPEDWQTAFALGTELLDTLGDGGEPSTGDLAIAIFPVLDEITSAAEWPLALDPTAVIDRRSLATVDWHDDDGRVLFHAGTNAETLRGTREMLGGSTRAFEYRPASGEQVLIWVGMRDEPPPAVRAALELTRQSTESYRSAIGGGCAPELCLGELQCSMPADDSGGVCTACLSPTDTDFACQGNDDCCDGLVCCVDCGAESGTCMAALDPCAACVDRGGSWLALEGVCADEGCEPDSVCFTSECPDLCAPDDCSGCFDDGECWAAGCTWSYDGPNPVCLSPEDFLPLEPCETDATDPSLPGVSVHLEGDGCAFRVGQGGEFRYSVTLTEALDFTTVSSEGACGRCGYATELDTWVGFSIGGDGAAYCPACDVGCCPPTEALPASVEAQTIAGTVDWPGLQFSGPSDTGNEPAGAFPPGEYNAMVVVELPGLGSVTASLPISVLANEN